METWFVEGIRDAFTCLGTARAERRPDGPSGGRTLVRCNHHAQISRNHPDARGAIPIRTRRGSNACTCLILTRGPPGSWRNLPRPVSPGSFSTSAPGSPGSPGTREPRKPLLLATNRRKSRPDLRHPSSFRDLDSAVFLDGDHVLRLFRTSSSFDEALRALQAPFAQAAVGAGNLLATGTNSEDRPTRRIHGRFHESTAPVCDGSAGVVL